MAGNSKPGGSKPAKASNKGSFQKAQQRELSIKTFPMPADTIVQDFISAGWLLAQMDLAGGRRAYKYIQGRCVTIGIEAMSFRKPVFVGDEVSFYTEIEKEGNTSLRLKVEAWAHQRGGKKEEKVTEGTFTFVAIDENRKPTPIAEIRKKSNGVLPPPKKPGEIPPRPHAPSSDVEPQPGGGIALSLRMIPEPKDTNYQGDIFGGWLLAQMDKACAKAAEKHTGYKSATVGLEAMKFLSPVFVGDELSFYTEVVRTGRTSVTVRVESWSLRADRQREKVTEGLFTYVAIDRQRKPVPINAGPV
jgi:acyl-CoA thioesterase YciA